MKYTVGEHHGDPTTFGCATVIKDGAVLKRLDERGMLPSLQAMSHVIETAYILAAKLNNAYLHGQLGNEQPESDDPLIEQAWLEGKIDGQ